MTQLQTQTIAQGASRLCILMLLSITPLLLNACGGGGGGGGSSARAAELEDPPLLYASVNIPYTYELEIYGSPAPSIRVEGLPDWLEYLPEERLVTGTPTAADIGLSEEVLVHVFNGVTRDVIHRFQIEVDPDSGAPAAPTIGSAARTAAEAGVEYRYDVTSTGNPRPTISAKNLPDWLSVVDGTIVGIPPAEAVDKSFNIEVRARNGIDPYAVQMYTLEVREEGTPANPQFSVLTPPLIWEGDSGGDGYAKITVALGIAATSPVSVDYATADGSATEGLDYAGVSGTLNFLAGEVSKTVDVLIYGDDDIEQDETFTFTISNAVGAPIVTAFQTVTISDNDNAGGSVVINVAPPSPVLEEDTGMQSVDFAISLTTAGTNNITVSYSTMDGTATATEDYLSTSGMVVFAPGETTKSVSVDILGDMDVEGDEDFTLEISNPVNAVVGTGSATCDILENDSNMSVLLVGSGAGGAMANGTTNDQATPSYAEDETLNNITGALAIALGDGFGLALLQSGEVWAWGDNSLGQTGSGLTDAMLVRAAPVRDGASNALDDVIAIAAGAAHAVAIRSDGSVWTWGDNSFGQLGNSSVTGTSNVAVPVEDAPGGNAFGNAASIATGANHCIAVLNDGSAFAWGDNGSGQLAAASINASEAHPVAVVDATMTALTNVDSASAGQSHSIFVTTALEVLAAGDNSEGQLGDGTTTARDTAAPVLDASMQPLGNVAATSCGAASSYALLASGEVLAWGLNGSGQLGDASQMNRMLPVTVLNDATQPLADVSGVWAGSTHVIAQLADGSFVAWGANGSGQLGNGSIQSTATARPVLNAQTNPMRGQSAAAGDAISGFIQ